MAGRGTVAYKGKTYNGKKGVSAYRKGGKSNYKKKSYQSKTEKASVELCMKYSADHFVASMDQAISGRPDTTKLSCEHHIPVTINDSTTNAQGVIIPGDLQKMFDKNVKDKYEEYRIAKMEIKVMFKATDTPVWFLIDEEDLPKRIPDQFVADANSGYKMVKDNNNSLSVTWRPKKGSSDYDYKPVSSQTGDNPLAYINLLQYEIEESAANNIAVGKKGCDVHIKVTVACKGSTQTALSAPLTAAQTALLRA
jgi:hypothetical protein